MGAAAGLGAAVPFVGVGLQVLGMGLDIAQSIDAKKKQRDADRAAAESLAQAKSKIEVNRMEGLQVPLDAYEQAGREITAQHMQSLEGLREADARTLAAGVGKSSAAGAMATEKKRQQMADAIYARDKMVADEQATIDRALATINLQEAEGAQMAAAQREQMSAQALSGALTGLGGAAQTFYEGQSLYGNQANRTANQLGKYGITSDVSALGSNYTPEQLANIGRNAQYIPSINQAGLSIFKSTF